MNELETEKAGASEVERLRQECAALQRQTTNQLVALIVLSCTLCAFLYLQRRYAKADLLAIKPPATRLIQNYQAFGARLREYGRTHPDFVPVLSKYGIAVAPGPAPAAAPVPPATAPPKPPVKQ
jgi:hypothetical protein